MIKVVVVAGMLMELVVLVVVPSRSSALFLSPAAFMTCVFISRLLYSVLPPSVANELRHKRPVPAKRYDNVTILFSGIVGFNAFCSKHASAEGAIKIVNLLNDVYTRFDILTDTRKNPYVYKVRTPHRRHQHAFIVLLCFPSLAFQMPNTPSRHKTLDEVDFIDVFFCT